MGKKAESVGSYSGCSAIIMRKAALNIQVQFFVCEYMSLSLLSTYVGFSKYLDHFTFPPAVPEGSTVSTPSIILLERFYLNSSTDQWWWVSSCAYWPSVYLLFGLLRWLSGKESACKCWIHRFNPWVRKIPWRRKWQPTPIFLPGESHGQRSLVGYSPWGCKESDRNKYTHMQTFFGEMSLWIPCLLFSCQFLLLSCNNSFLYAGCKTLISYMLCK